MFAADGGVGNHVLADGEVAKHAVEVPMQTLDAIMDDRSPILIKIDVEGFEKEVLHGAARALKSASLLAVIMELNASGARYGVDDAELHQSMLEHGFATYRYSPFERVLSPVEDRQRSSSNLLYVRDISELRRRVREAKSYRLGIGVDI